MSVQTEEGLTVDLRHHVPSNGSFEQPPVGLTDEEMTDWDHLTDLVRD